MILERLFLSTASLPVPLLLPSAVSSFTNNSGSSAFRARARPLDEHGRHCVRIYMRAPVCVCVRTQSDHVIQSRRFIHPNTHSTKPLALRRVLRVVLNPLNDNTTIARSPLYMQRIIATAALVAGAVVQFHFSTFHTQIHYPRARPSLRVERFTQRTHTYTQDARARFAAMVSQRLCGWRNFCPSNGNGHGRAMYLL